MKYIFLHLKVSEQWSQTIPKKITKFECNLHIPESCKWDSKKRNRKTVEQKNNNEEETEEVEDETTDRDFGFLSQANHKRAPTQENIQNSQVVEEFLEFKSWRPTSIILLRN